MRTLPRVAACLSTLLIAGSIGGSIAGSLGCSAEGEETTADNTAPIVTISAPERGTYVAGDFVDVAGVVTDDGSGFDKLTVNGVPADVGDDGSFSARVPLSAGVTILETVGRDLAGNEALDHRGVLAGQLAPVGTPVRDGFIAELTPATFSVVGDIAAANLAKLDFAAIGEAVSPIVDRGNSCFGVEVDLRDITFADLNVALVPQVDGVDVVVTASDLYVDMRANYEVGCFGGGAGVNIEADALIITGRLGIVLESGRFVASLTDSSAVFEGFDLDVGAIPDSIVNLFVSDIDDKAANALIGALQSVVPQTVETALEGFSSSAFTTSILDIETTIELSPTSVEISESGARIVVDFAAATPQMSETTYVATPQIAPGSDEMSGESLGLAVADDVANQLLAILWHSGALDQELAVGGTPLRELFPDASVVTIEMLLPPMISTNPETMLAGIGIADLLITAKDGADNTLAQLALSGHIDVGVSLTAGGLPVLGATLASLSSTILSGSESLGLTPAQVNIIAEVGINELAKQFDGVLANLRIPKIGAEIRSPTIGATRGYLLISGQLATE